MDITSKIKERKAKIEVAQKRIETEQAKIAKLKKELETLENLEIKALLKEIDVPVDQVVSLLSNAEFVKMFKEKEETQNSAAVGEEV